MHLCYGRSTSRRSLLRAGAHAVAVREFSAWALWASLGREDYLAFAQGAAKKRTSGTTNLDGNGNHRYPKWPRVKSWKGRAETSYSIGASCAGVALTLVPLAAQWKYRAIVPRDHPFATPPPT